MQIPPFGRNDKERSLSRTSNAEVRGLPWGSVQFSSSRFGRVDSGMHGTGSCPLQADKLTTLQKQRIVFTVLLIAAAAIFIVRGPLRYLQPTNWNDLAQNYAATRIWLRGQNFADPQNFVALWRDEVHSTIIAQTTRTHLAPPPGTLVLMAPIGALPWPAAKIAWLIVLLASFAATVWALVKTAGFHWEEPRTLAFIAGCLALAPFHTGIASANQTILVVGLCALGILCATNRRDFAAGLFFGAACSLKPHIGTFLVLYYLVQRRWRLFVTAVAFTALLALVAIGWMEVSGVSLAHDYFHNVKVLAAENKIDDFTSANPIRFLLINLQVPIYSFTADAKSANLLSLSIVTVLIGVWIFLIARKNSRVPELLALGTIAVMGLMPVYHRLYDASLLAIPFCWCLTRHSLPMKRVSALALVLMIPFFVPGTAILQQAARSGRIPATWTQSWWWDRVLMPHESWILLALSLVLLYGVALEYRQTRGH